MATQHRLAHRLEQPGQQNHRNHRQRSRKPECRRSTDTADQRGAACKGNGARELDTGIRRREEIWRHQ